MMEKNNRFNFQMWHAYYSFAHIVWWEISLCPENSTFALNTAIELKFDDAHNVRQKLNGLLLREPRVDRYFGTKIPIFSGNVSYWKSSQSINLFWEYSAPQRRFNGTFSKYDNFWTAWPILGLIKRKTIFQRNSLNRYSNSSEKF